MFIFIYTRMCARSLFVNFYFEVSSRRPPIKTPALILEESLVSEVFKLGLEEGGLHGWKRQSARSNISPTPRRHKRLVR